MDRISVLLVDDSPFSLEVLSSILSTDESICVAGTASNGVEAVRAALKCKPDIVTMDLDMPVMNGLDAIEKIMRSSPVPILVVSGKADADMAFKALSRGALDVMSKAEVNIEDGQEFINKIKLLAKVKVIAHISSRGLTGAPHHEFVKHDNTEVIAIASSTGGPKALNYIISGLPKDFPIPLVVAQHIQSYFVHTMADWLDQSARYRVKVAEDGELLEPMTVYISPSDRHLAITAGKRTTFMDVRPGDIYHPSCDILLSSVAEAYGRKCTGVILTGMGRDGVEGLRRIKEAGGKTIAQDEKSSVIYGMPKAAVEKGCVDMVMPLENIAVHLASLKTRSGGVSAIGGQL